MFEETDEVLPPRNPRTLVDIDNPDDAEPGDGPEDDELPEIDVREIESPDEGSDILENNRRERLYRSL